MVGNWQRRRQRRKRSGERGIVSVEVQVSAVLDVENNSLLVMLGSMSSCRSCRWGRKATQRKRPGHVERPSEKARRGAGNVGNTPHLTRGEVEVLSYSNSRLGVQSNPRRRSRERSTDRATVASFGRAHWHRTRTPVHRQSAHSLAPTSKAVSRASSQSSRSTSLVLTRSCDRQSDSATSFASPLSLGPPAGPHRLAFLKAQGPPL